MTTPSSWNRAALGMGPWRTWLTDQGSLTRRLRGLCPGFRVRRLRQGTARPQHDERAVLALPAGRSALVREVLLLCDATPLVFAHSIVPLASLHGPWHALALLGQRPLGEALFADPKVERHPLEFRRLDPRHPLHRRACADTGAALGPLWARRSLFALHAHPLLVTEVFLPALLRHAGDTLPA